jgi:SAM-dependent methyltransferase
VIKNIYKDIPDNVSHIISSLISEDDVYHKNHARRMARTLQLLSEEYRFGNLLEVGTSHLLPVAIREAQLDVDITVTDFDLSKEKVGSMSCEINGKKKEVNVVRVNIEDEILPLPDEYFDTVLLCEVIEHMDVDPMHVLSELNRVMKKDAVLIVTTPNITSSRNIYKMLNGNEPYFYMQYRKHRDPYRHNYEYSLPTLEKVLAAAGFKGRLWTEDNFEDGIDLNLFFDTSRFRVNHLGDNIFAVVKKVGPVVDRYPGEIYVD